MGNVLTTETEEGQADTKINRAALWWSVLQYHWEGLSQFGKARLVILAWVLLMSQVVRYLIYVNLGAYVLLIAFVALVRSPELSLIAGLGVGLLTGATFILWVLKDVINK